MSKMPINYQAMSTEQLGDFVRIYPDDEEAFIEYNSRLDWKMPPKFNSPQEEEEFIQDLIASKTRKDD